MAEGRDFCGRAEEVITIPFCLGRRARGLAAEPAGGQHDTGRGSLHLPASSKATSKGRRFPVNIKATVFHGKGLFLSGAKATTGFIYKGLGCVSELDEDGDEGEGEVENADWGALSGSTRLVPVGGSPRPMTYIVGLMDSGEGSVTFPSSLADVLLEDADAFNLVYGSLTFLFMFAYEGRVAASSASGPEDKGQGHLGHTPQHPQAPESIQKESGVGFESYPNKPVRKQQKTSMGADPRGEWMNGNLSPVSMDKIKLLTDWKVTEEVSISGEKACSVRNEEARSIHGTDVDCGMVKVPDFDPDSDSDPKPNPSDLIYPMDTQDPL
ncbi:hypothetical protein MJG53_002317 [Ovis ammon polii x Ovis aries]|uniref:Uncharacterized protein n=1 Tax=Ovis ammon polii x Ovis aries TaxID=2918886 RepID=A0ACB9VNC5_9CETA|nr:hypothetical protein MJG53_002317 [Ovis ammon polii x Ovis aries]